MADPSPPAGPSDRAGRVFSLAEQLGSALHGEHQRYRVGLDLPDAGAWDRQRPGVDELCAALEDCRDLIERPPGGFAPVAAALRETARVAREVQQAIEEPLNGPPFFAGFLEFSPSLVDAAESGRRAIRKAVASRPVDPLAFINPTPTGAGSGIDTTPTPPEPPSSHVEAAGRAIHLCDARTAVRQPARGDTSAPVGPPARVGQEASDHVRELREFVPLVENPRPYQPSPPPPEGNPYLTLRHVLHELFWMAAVAQDGQDVRQHINPITGPWDGAEARARGSSAGWGIPFATFDPILTDAKRTMRELVQVAAGNTSVPFSATDFRYALLEERLQELANSVPAPAEAVSRAETTPDDTGRFLEHLLTGPDDVELAPRDLVRLEAHLKQPIPLSAIQREKAASGNSQTQANRNKLKLIRDFNRRLQQTKTVDDLVSKIYVDRPRDLDPQLAEAFSAVATGIRECTRLLASVPHLWTDEGEYRRLAAGVADAATAARAAYMAVDIRLRRAGGPNPMLDALDDVLTVQGRAPLDPTGTPGGLNAILTNLYTNPAELFSRVQGRGYIDRMLDQLARVPPPTSPDSAAPPLVVAKSTPALIEMNPGEGDITAKGRSKGKDIHGRMLKLLADDLNRYDWSVRQFAERLGCREGTVKGTKAWKQVMAYRAATAAERIARTGKLDGGRRRKRG